jgi:hypothetical protein
MNKHYFIKQKSRKVVFLLFIIPAILQLVLINIIKSINSELLYYFLFLLFGLLYLPFFYWLSISINYLHENSRKYFNLKLINFKISLLVNILILFNFVFFVAYIFSFIFFKEGSPEISTVVIMAFIQIIGVVFFAYSNYFVGCLLTTLQLNRKVNFNEITSNLIALSIPPFAIWIIQKKVKDIYDSKN